MLELLSKSVPYSEILQPPEKIAAYMLYRIPYEFPENISSFLRTFMDKAWELDMAARPTMLHNFMY